MARKSIGKSIRDLNYETAFVELQKAVALLEGEPESLEQAMALFERGRALVQRCTQLLEQAELKVKELSTTGEAGASEE